jgi:hypothetical protein
LKRFKSADTSLSARMSLKHIRSLLCSTPNLRRARDDTPLKRIFLTAALTGPPSSLLLFPLNIMARTVGSLYEIDIFTCTPSGVSSKSTLNPFPCQDFGNRHTGSEERRCCTDLPLFSSPEVASHWRSLCSTRDSSAAVHEKDNGTPITFFRSVHFEVASSFTTTSLIHGCRAVEECQYVHQQRQKNEVQAGIGTTSCCRNYS